MLFDSKRGGFGSGSVPPGSGLGGEQTFERVPAGRIEVRQRQGLDEYDPKAWRRIGEVDVAVGEQAELRLEETD
ncbi:hypothetical protein [Planctomycetes bacterium Poly30]|uniref:hypothetical protein n=1 Tax=Saltatorellus ferox TaxID=2528018 RepID=UPI0011A48CC9